MISIIICNKKNNICPELEDNIRDTIGVTYEIINIDNSRGQYSIFQAYNEGVRQATGDTLCFMHDDILFRSNGWGRIIEDALAADERMGALGVAGGHFMPDCPCSWSTCKTTSFHVWQTNPDGTATEYGCTDYADGKNLVEVASLDGLFICIRRSLFNTIRFDDQTFTGFHCYDSDICMQVLALGYSVNVTLDIDIEHRSNGACNQQYYDNIERWHKKWHSHLPVARGIQLTDSEKRIHQEYAIELIEQGKEMLSLYQKLGSPYYRLGYKLLKPYRFLKRKLK